MSLEAEILLIDDGGEELPLAIINSGESTSLSDYSVAGEFRAYEVLTSGDGLTAIFVSREANFNPSDILSLESVHETHGRERLLLPGEEYTHEKFRPSLSAQAGKLIIRNVFGTTLEALPTTQPIT